MGLGNMKRLPAILTFFVCFLMIDAAMAVCGNGILEVGEECDDGNNYSGDGCDRSCALEDVAGNEWLCTTPAASLSVCCPVLINPITLAEVCSCNGITQPDASVGFTVTSNCEKRNVDECNTNNGNCHANANCIDHDVTLDAVTTHSCTCPPGWRGDGVTTCDINTYETEFKIVEYNVNDVDLSVVTSELKTSGVIPASVSVDDIQSSLQPFFGAAPVARRLLSVRQTGVEITVTIRRDTSDLMNNLVSSISMNSLPAKYAVTAPPYSVVLVSGRGVVNTLMGGFSVDSVVFSSVTNTWEIDSRYVPNLPNTVASPFISRMGPSPSTLAQATFEGSAFPCLSDNSVCCLNDYKDLYVIGGFAQNISDKVGSCDASVQAADTTGMFDVSSSQAFVMDLVKDYPLSKVSMSESGKFRLSLSTGDIQNNFATRRDVGNGYELKFFVGMAYFGLIASPGVIDTMSSQVQLTINVSPSLTFAFTSQQKATFVQSISMAVYQNKWMDSLLTPHKMQSVRLGILFPNLYNLQNTKTGLIPLNSIRFAVAQTMPSKEDSGAWTNPCFSGQLSGMYDAGQPWETMYKNSAAQSCAFGRKLCLNPSTIALNKALVEFNFPIGDDTINSAIQNDGSYHLFVTFEISVLDPSGAELVTDVFVESPIRGTSITKQCESLDFSMSLSSMTEIDMHVGIAGTEDAWSTSVTSVTDVMRNMDYNKVYSSGVLHNSLANSLVTLVVKTKQILIDTKAVDEYYLTMDYMTSMHFLDNVKFTEIQSLIQNGLAYTTVMNNGFLEVRWSTSAAESCSTDNKNLYSCAIRRNVVAGVKNSAQGVHDFSLPDHSNDDEGCTSFITSNLLGNNEFSKDLALNMTKLVRSKFGIDNYMNRAWYINPGFEWPSPQGVTTQSKLTMSDKMIAVAVISLRNSATGKVTLRRLMTVVSGDNKNEIPVPESDGSSDDDADGHDGNNDVYDENNVLVPESGVDDGNNVPVPESGVDDGNNVPVPESQTVEDDTYEITIIGNETEVVSNFDKSQRRLLQLQPTGTTPSPSGSQKLKSAIDTIVSRPIGSNTLIFGFNIDIPQTISGIYGVPTDKNWSFVELALKVNTGLTDTTSIRDSVSLVMKNGANTICPSCDGFLPVFQNVRSNNPLGTARRKLKQADTLPEFDLSFTYLMTYQGNTTEQGLVREALQKLLQDSSLPGLSISLAGYSLQGTTIPLPSVTPVPSTPAPATPVPSRKSHEHVHVHQTSGNSYTTWLWISIIVVLGFVCMAYFVSEWVKRKNYSRASSVDKESLLAPEGGSGYNTKNTIKFF